MIKLTKKQLIITSFAVVVLAIVGSLTWVWAAQTAKNHYIAQVNAYRSQVHDTLQSFDQQFTGLQTGAPNDSVVAALNQVDGELTKLLAAAPAEPKLLGISVAPDQAKNDSHSTSQWLLNLKQTTNESLELIAYKSQILAVLKVLSQQKATNAQEQEALTTLWRQAYDQLNKIQPPPKASSFHAELASTIESISATISSLPELYTAKDYAGFIAKQKELESKIAGLRSLHSSLEDLNQAFDQSLRTQLEVLRQ